MNVGCVFQLDVKEKMEVKNHPQWDMPDEDDEDKDMEEVTESEGSSYDESDED